MLAAGARPRPATPRHALEVFLAILGLFLISLLGTSRYAYRFRRSQTVATLIGGGWLSVLVGLLVGPEVAGLVSRETVLQTVPLLTLALGWIGFLAGFQVRIAVLRAVPKRYFLAVAADTAITTAVVGGAALYAFHRWAPEAPALTLWLPLAFVVAASLGWKLETRSVGLGIDQRAALKVRATGTLLGIVAILAFGFAALAVERNAQGEVALTLERGVYKALHTLLLAIVIGGAGRYLVRAAGNSFGYKLAIFLGIITFTAGSASQIGASPLVASALAGVVFSNIKPDTLDEFERFILRAEHLMAVLFGVLVGILMDPGFAAWGWGLVGLLLLCRVVFKPATLRLTTAAGDDEMPPRARKRLMFACVRQSPIMFVLAVSLVLLEPSVFHQQLLAVLVIVGVASEVMPVFTGARLDRPGVDAEGAQA